MRFVRESQSYTCALPENLWVRLHLRATSQIPPLTPCVRWPAPDRITPVDESNFTNGARRFGFETVYRFNASTPHYSAAKRVEYYKKWNFVELFNFYGAKSDNYNSPITRCHCEQVGRCTRPNNAVTLVHRDAG